MQRLIAVDSSLQLLQCLAYLRRLLLVVAVNGGSVDIDVARMTTMELTPIRR